MPKVAVLMGSDSDWDSMSEAVKALEEMGIEPLVDVISAHRTPTKLSRFVRGAEARGVRLFVCGAGLAAHLAGVVAAHTSWPVLGVPLASGSLQGFDALLSTVQMPPGVPVATFAIGKAGARNAGLFAAQILALSDASVARRVKAAKKQLAAKVDRASRAVRRRRQGTPET